MSMVMALFEWSGQPEDLRQRYDAALHHVVAVSPARPLVHLAWAVGDGFRVADVWDNESICAQMIDNPDFRATLEQFGLAEARVDVVPLHNLGWPISAAPLYR